MCTCAGRFSCIATVFLVMEEAEVAALSKFLDPAIFEFLFPEIVQTKPAVPSVGLQNLMGNEKLGLLLLAVNLSSVMNKN